MVQNGEKMKIELKDFETAFGEKVSNFIKDKIKECDFSYDLLSEEEKNNFLIKYFNVLTDDTVKKAGPSRIKDWHNGWLENCNEFDNGLLTSLIPKYFGKFPYVRWNKEIIKPRNKDFEYNMARILQYWLFEKFFLDVNHVYEFGCGTGHNLLRVNETCQNSKKIGLDWATSSQKTIKKINASLGTNFDCDIFDFFNCNRELILEKNSGVYTFAALEQINDKYEDFVNYLIENKPSICLHIEPIAELLDENNLMDFLSKKYFEKRNYLSGFYNCLKDLENKGKIEIIFEKPSFIGSIYINGYSIVAWRVKNA
jgi:hypothetical protein